MISLLLVVLGERRRGKNGSEWVNYTVTQGTLSDILSTIVIFNAIQPH